MKQQSWRSFTSENGPAGTGGHQNSPAELCVFEGMCRAPPGGVKVLTEGMEVSAMPWRITEITWDMAVLVWHT